MKLFKLTSFYTAYIQDFYAKRPALEGQSYARQKAALDYDAFGEGDFWSYALTPLGYEVMEVTANIEPLQKAWAGEHGIDLYARPLVVGYRPGPDDNNSSRPSCLWMTIRLFPANG